MTCKDIFNGSTGNRATLLILDADGQAKTGVAYDAAGLAIAYRIDTGSQVAITLTSGNWFEIGGGKYLVDVADSVYLAANLGKYIQFYGSLTSSSVYGEQHRVVANNPSVLLPSAATGDWSITRTFQVAGGDKVSGVRMSLVGVAGKTDTTGTDGIATIKADDGTFTLRVVVPAGYEDVADTTVTINGADSTATVTLVATAVTPADPPLCAVTLPVVDQHGTPIAGVSVMIEFVSFDSTADPDAVVMSPPPVETSDESGLVTVDLLRLANYKATYAISGSVKRVDFLVPDAGSYIVVEPN